MASPAEVMRILPDTLPEDFSEWDNDNSPTRPPAGDDGSEGSNGPGVYANPFAQSGLQYSSEPQVTPAPRQDELLNLQSSLLAAPYSDRDALGARMQAINAALKSKSLTASDADSAKCATTDVCLQPARKGGAVADALGNSPALLPSTVNADEEAFFNQLRAIGNVLNIQEFGDPHKQAPARGTDEASFKSVPLSGVVPRRWPVKPIQVTATIDAGEQAGTPMFQSDLADLGDESQNRKKWINVAAIAASFLLSVVLGVWLLSPSRPASAKQSVPTQPVVAAVAPAIKTHKPSAAGRHSRAIKDGRQDGKAEDYLLPPVDSQQVNEQLTATPRASVDNKVLQ